MTRYFNSLYGYGTRITRDCALAEDCIQDLFTEFWIKRDGLSEVKNIKYYLFKSLRRKIIYELSRESRFISSDSLVFFDIELSHKMHCVSQQINSEIRKKLRISSPH